MRYPDNMLAEEEWVVLHRHPHWKCLVGPVLALLASTALASFGGAYVGAREWDSSFKTVVSSGISVIWLVVVGWLAFWPFLRWRTTHFVVTDRRVMFRFGLPTRAGIDIPLARIDSVGFRHGLVDGILHTGTLTVESGSHDPVEFYDVPNVEEVHSLLYREVFDTFGSEG